MSCAFRVHSPRHFYRGTPRALLRVGAQLPSEGLRGCSGCDVLQVPSCTGCLLGLPWALLLPCASQCVCPSSEWTKHSPRGRLQSYRGGHTAPPADIEIGLDKGEAIIQADINEDGPKAQKGQTVTSSPDGTVRTLGSTCSLTVVLVVMALISGHSGHQRGGSTGQESPPQAR